MTVAQERQQRVLEFLKGRKDACDPEFISWSTGMSYMKVLNAIYSLKSAGLIEYTGMSYHRRLYKAVL